MATNNVPVNQEKEKKEVLMPDADRKLLKSLYLLRSYSGFEEPVRNFIMDFLDEHDIPYVNYNGNILGLNNPGMPLFSAHMDMVNTEGYIFQSRENAVEGDYVFTVDNDTNLRLYRDKEERKHQTSLGADDKNGIWVILKLLEAGFAINFAFCHSEEVGGTGSKQIIECKELAEQIAECQFGIIIDRRNKGDIIGYENKYCMALDDRLEAFAKSRKYPYTCATGSISDADRFSQLIECVNISCGYYSPHTSSEYTNLNELWMTLQFCMDVLLNFQYESVSEKRMKKFKGISTYTKPATTTATYDYTNYYTNKYVKDDDKEEDVAVKKNSGKDDTDNRWWHYYGGY